MLGFCDVPANQRHLRFFLNIYEEGTYEFSGSNYRQAARRLQRTLSAKLASSSASGKREIS